MTKKSNITLEDFRPIEWVEVPYYSSGVRAGIPERPGDEAYETISIPKELITVGSYGFGCGLNERTPFTSSNGVCGVYLYIN
ncbi:MAG: hypothetical protein MJZ79_07405 [Paludibacteraceae bacterium]|nr:hypothetical protein [Paludibacteraceae bacterium]